MNHLVNRTRRTASADRPSAHPFPALLPAVLAAALTAPFLAGGHAQAQCVAPPDMTGVWRANDGGTYTVRQFGNQVYWLGQSADGGRSWTNVFHGTRSGNTVTGSWADLPSGRVRGGGTMTLNVSGSTGVLGWTRGSATGGFGGSRWWQPCGDTVLNPVGG